MVQSGDWMRRNLEVGEQFGDTWTVVSNRHSDREDIDPRRESAFQAPPYPGVPDRTETFIEGDATGLIDRTPVTHSGTPRNPNMDLAALGAVHTGGYGAEIPHTKTFARFMKQGDQIVLLSQQDHGAPPSARDPINRPDLVRGLNAFPVNNPPKEMYAGEGWRRTFWYSRRDTHRLSLPQWKHRWRIVPKWVAARPLNRAATEGTVQTGLQWDGLSRSIKNRFDRPKMRRQPGFVGEDAVTDGLDELSAQVGEFI